MINSNYIKTKTPLLLDYARVKKKKKKKKAQSQCGSDWCAPLKQKPTMPPGDDQYAPSETEPQLAWHEGKQREKMQSGHLLLHTGAWQLLSDTRHITGRRKPDVWGCPAAYCVCAESLCMRNALLIKLMDSAGRSLLRTPGSPLSPLSLLSAPCH